MMRFHKTHAVVATLLLSATAWATAAVAQTSPGPTEQTTSAAQTSSVVPAPTAAILSIPLPPNARLRLDVDARDEDVLGVVKSFLRGFKGNSLKDVLDSMNRVHTPANGDNTSAGAPADIQTSAALRMLSDADLETILRNVKQLRFVVFETANPYRSGNNSSYQSSRARATQAAQSVLAYYENAYLTREGGRRIARGDFDETQMMVVGFPGRGFAVLFQTPGLGVVIRGDGYPNFEGVGPLVMGMGLRFAPAIR
ncbi:MAG TPA: hypothetical protein VF600_08455 [Abditibacteriaceae bacterium]|jgi:hypothetical protein